MQTTLPLADQDKIERRFKALKVRQPIGDIYIASVDYRPIQEITFFDVRRRLQEQRDVEQYLGIQRPLNDRRVTELQKYVNYIDATFPGTIIVSVENDYGAYDEATGEIVVSNTRWGEDKPTQMLRQIARVIDGQHRIAGLEGFVPTAERQNFDVMVAFFVGSDISDQAYVFATVNLEQTKVNKSLAYDLFSLAKSRSPFKTCHNIAVALDQLPTSPFYQKIKRLGTSGDERGEETLTQATFVNGLIVYLSRDPKLDRDLIIRNHPLPQPSADDLRKLVFRGLFVKGDDVLIGKVYEEYFQAVKERWPEAWAYSGTGIMLWRTNGYRALSSIFGRVYKSVAKPGQAVTRMDFSPMFNRVKLNWQDFNTDRFKPGSSGEGELRRLLVTEMTLFD
ncbi:DGQHR domain-containing protein [Pseudaminobacter sp. NGMCC 1.201702]|uniref:DGQHR domain-containing protein n=1 Tax=Pseudaminobacter sp. NGMCC 1.201702 TaxID=3391825 RepID=UPI0039EF6DFC